MLWATPNVVAQDLTRQDHHLMWFLMIFENV